MADTDDKYCKYPLTEIVMAIAELAGMEPSMVDVSLLQGIMVRGLTITDVYPAANALRTLSQIFFFDPSDHGGFIRFVPRGLAPVKTIRANDMLTDANVEEVKRDAMAVPRVLQLNYYDPNGGMSNSMQMSERVQDGRSNNVASLATAVILNADEAKQAVVKNHRVQVEEKRGTVEIVLPDNFLELRAADVLLVEIDDKLQRMRIDELSIDDGKQTLKMHYDRQSAYTSKVLGIPVTPPSPTPDNIQGATRFEMLDIPLLKDSDDALGFYLALAGEKSNFAGSYVEISADNGATYTPAGELTARTVIGKTTSDLAPGNRYYLNAPASFTIEVGYDVDWLENVDLRAMLNRANMALIGDEIIQFQSFKEIKEGTYELSGLLRGRLGTGNVTHAAGERFVLLDRGNLYFIPVDMAYQGKELTVRATTLSASPDKTVVKKFTFSGNNQKERAPVYATAHINHNLNVTVSWQGIGRIGSGAHVAMGANFRYYVVEAYLKGNQKATFYPINESLTFNINENNDFGAEQNPELQRLTIKQFNSITGAGPAVDAEIIYEDR